MRRESLSPYLEALLRRYVQEFNLHDEESDTCIANSQAADWMLAHVPLVRLPDAALEQAYYFRWWVYRKHVKQTPDGMVVTEFSRDVPWAGRHNTIVAAAGHHIDEGRWLRDTTLLDDYIEFFYRKGGNPRLYSNWLEHSVLGLCEARGDASLGVKLLDAMVRNQLAWDESNLHNSGLYWSSDDRDAGEFSISGSGLRPTLNCYQYANKKAIAAFAWMKGEKELAEQFEQSAWELGDKINHLLWEEESQFYKTIPLRTREEKTELSLSAHDVREIWGYWPWLFGAAPHGRVEAFRQLKDPNGFRAAYGLTTAERRHQGFGLFYSGDELNKWLANRGEEPVGPKGHECLWNGPSWPFSSCMALGALGNLLSSGEEQTVISLDDYRQLLTQYARAHVRKTEKGLIPWLDENLNPDTGDWISRTRLSEWDSGGWSNEKGGYERGKDYNHSTFCNLIISGLFGIKPTLKSLRITPLFPKEWPYALLESVKVHGHHLTLRYDNPQLGGDGYRIYVDGECVFWANFPEQADL